MTADERKRSYPRSAARKPAPARQGDERRGGRAGNRDHLQRRARDERQTEDRPVAHIDDEIVRELRATARPGKGEILVKVFSEAVGAYLTEDYRDAVRLGEQAKHIALRSPSARELLGLAYYRAGSYKEAARELSAFKRLTGSLTQNAVLADCYRAIGKRDKALELVDELDYSSVEPAVFYEGAIVGAGALADEGRVDEAIERLERLDLRPPVAEDHHLRAWYVLGDLLQRKGRFSQARSWFEAVAAADAESTDAPARAARLAKGR
ncbi:MAG: CDC27 family protein [Actinomycetota bacterium]|nr:CDC27 family protein [Actinomycetota bacterium]